MRSETLGLFSPPVPVLSDPPADPDARSQMQLFHHFFFLNPRFLSSSLSLPGFLLRCNSDRLWRKSADVKACGRTRGFTFAASHSRKAQRARQLVCSLPYNPPLLLHYHHPLLSIRSDDVSQRRQNLTASLPGTHRALKSHNPGTHARIFLYRGPTIRETLF